MKNFKEIDYELNRKLREFKPYEIVGEKHENEFLNKPIDEYIENFEENMENKKIILTGGRGVGKSTLLNALQKRYIQFYLPFVLTEFNPIDIPLEVNEIFNEKFFIHYFEEQMALEILRNIANDYKLDYKNYFLEFESKIQASSLKTKEYIERNGKIYLNYLAFSQITKELITKYKSMLDCDSITLAIDRFDWINNGNGIAQKIISQYFDLFDKVIITSDDSSLYMSLQEQKALNENSQNEKIKELNQKLLHQKEKLEDLKKKGFNIQNLNYSYDTIVVQNILIKIIEYYTNISPILNIFPINIITSDFTNVLIYKTNGNIYEMINIIIEIYKVWLCKENLNGNDLIAIIKEKIENFEALGRSRIKTKLYL